MHGTALTRASIARLCPYHNFDAPITRTSSSVPAAPTAKHVLVHQCWEASIREDHTIMTTSITCPITITAFNQGATPVRSLVVVGGRPGLGG
jgi:hypothetical protein